MRKDHEKDGWGGSRGERKGHGNTRWGLGRQRAGRQKKRRGDGRVESLRGADQQRLGGHRRHGAGGPGAGCAKAEGTRGVRRGDSPWLGVGRCPTLGWAGGAGQPPPPSRRSVSPGLAAGQLAPRPRLCPLARSLARWLGRPGRGAPPGRTETAACTAPPSPGPQPRRPLRRWPRLRSSSCPRPARPAPHPPRTAQLRTPRVSRVFSLCGISPAFRSGLCSGLPPRTKVVGRPEAFLFHL